MNINKNSHNFSTAIMPNAPRSVFNRNFQHKTTFNAGELIPIYLDEILPGDVFKVNTSFLIRTSTLIAPIMDNINLDVFFFFVPNRLVWDHWREFMGENTQNAWVSSTTYTIPQLIQPDSGWDGTTLADYFGLPISSSDNSANPLQKDLLSVNALPFRAYCLIWNEWFRDENLTKPTLFLTNDADVKGSNGSNYLTDPIKGGKPLPVSKYHDYFTSCLPAPQKGSAVDFQLSGLANVITGNEINDYNPTKAMLLGVMNNYSGYNGSWDSFNSDVSGVRTTKGNTLGFNVTSGYLNLFRNDMPFITTVDKPSTTIPVFNSSLGGASTDNTTVGLGVNNNIYLYPKNLYADLSTASGANFTINDLRFAFQLQRMLERDARGGTRYTELLRSHFGVVSADSTQQRPEYLGGFRRPINVNQVLQTSSTDSTSPLGNTGAFSLTSGSKFNFSKAFKEHGYVIGVACVRHERTYQQGLNRLWSRKTRTNFYWPVFANIGEQPVYTKELFYSYTPSTSTNLSGNSNDWVFGYNEAWAEYRYKPSTVSGYFRSSYTESLDFWHLADYYKTTPILSSDWIFNGHDLIDRTLAVTSDKVHQFIADFYFENRCSRPLPMYSVPGRIDHN